MQTKVECMTYSGGMNTTLQDRNKNTLQFCLVDSRHTCFLRVSSLFFCCQLGTNPGSTATTGLPSSTRGRRVLRGGGGEGEREREREREGGRERKGGREPEGERERERESESEREREGERGRERERGREGEREI